MYYKCIISVSARIVDTCNVELRLSVYHSPIIAISDRCRSDVAASTDGNLPVYLLALQNSRLQVKLTKEVVVDSGDNPVDGCCIGDCVN